MGQTAGASFTVVNTGTAAIQVSSMKLSGSGFQLVNSSNLPFSVTAGSTYSIEIQFTPKTVGDSSGQLVIASTSASNEPLSIALDGTGTSPSGSGSPALTSLACNQNTIAGAGSDTCTVTLSAAAGTGGAAVTLSSNNAAVLVPGTVTVPDGAMSAGFTATVSAVTTAQAATLSASAGGTTQTYTISLGASVPALQISTTSLNFGDVTVGSNSTQSVTMTSSGTAAVTVDTATVSGSGFSLSGVTFPATLNPGQTAVLSIQFDPTTAAPASGTVTIISNSATGATSTIALNGTGHKAIYQVDLTWYAPDSTGDPAVGYNIYRATGASSSYELLNPILNTPTSFTDNNAQSGNSYSYYVESVDALGNESAPSNLFTVTIP